jgi:pimeloyl-ACP methyl ester carboxylesterase
MPARPTTLVLVHGGTFSSTMWDEVVPRLATPALAVDLPGRRYHPADLSEVSRQMWVQSICDDLRLAGLTDVVLVGHSSGGYVIPGVAAAMPAAVRGLVFVAATVPAEGRPPVDHLRPDLRSLARETRDATTAHSRGKTLGGLRPGEPAIETDLEIVENGPRMGLEATGPLHEAFSWEGFPAQIPRTYVRCLRDRVVPPDLADVMIANMGGAAVVDIDAGHGVAMRAPGELAAVLDRCVPVDGDPAV